MFFRQFCEGFLLQVSKMPVSGKMNSTLSYFISAALSVWASPIEEACTGLTTMTNFGEFQFL